MRTFYVELNTDITITIECNQFGFAKYIAFNQFSKLDNNNYIIIVIILFFNIYFHKKMVIYYNYKKQ